METTTIPADQIQAGDYIWRTLRSRWSLVTRVTVTMIGVYVYYSDGAETCYRGAQKVQKMIQGEN